MVITIHFAYSWSGKSNALSKVPCIMTTMSCHMSMTKYLFSRWCWNAVFLAWISWISSQTMYRLKFMRADFACKKPVKDSKMCGNVVLDKACHNHNNNESEKPKP